MNADADRRRGCHSANLATRAAHAGTRPPRPDFTPTVVPIHPSVTYLYDEMDDLDAVFAGTREVFHFFEALRLCLPATTRVPYPAHSSHRPLAPEERARIGIGDGLVRLSEGIEALEDIIADLEQALAFSPSTGWRAPCAGWSDGRA